MRTVDFELHSDFDRDGRLTASQSERDERERPPGAIIVANLDADTRRPPGTVRVGQVVTLDTQRSRKTSGDDEIRAFRIVPASAGPPPGTTYQIKVVGWAASHVRLYDRRGEPLSRSPDLGFFNQYPISLGATPMQLGVEVTTLAGSPATHPATVTTARPSRPIPRKEGHLRPESRMPGIDEGLLRLELLAIAPGGGATVEDRGFFHIAPVVFMDNTARAVRIYVCEGPPVPDRTAAQYSPAALVNEPSIRDVQAALRGSGVPVVLVPVDVAQGDTWIQDQMQIGYCQAPDGWMYVAVHLPRLRADFVPSPRTINLSRFVTEHLPARDFGVFNDFWRREVPIHDARGQTHTLPFAHSYVFWLVLESVYGLHRWIVRERVLVSKLGARTRRATDARTRAQPPGNTAEVRQDVSVATSEAGVPTKLATVRRQVREVGLRLRGELERLAREAPTERGRESWRSKSNNLDNRLRELDRILPLTSEGLGVRIPQDPAMGPLGGLSLDLTGAEADRVYQRVAQLHAGENYGGNIEVGAPTKNAPLGKLVVGNARLDENSETMDPDILRFLEAQRQQPLVEINTSWLMVGHVDEVLTFVPNRRSPTGAAILRASPGLARDILEAARAKYVSGLPELHPQRTPYAYRPSTILDRWMRDGRHPVTHLFRGKMWRHLHGSGPLVTIVEPPMIYQELAAANARVETGTLGTETRRLVVHEIPLIAGPGDRRYPAGMSVFEVLYFEAGTNRGLESREFQQLDDQLTREFPGMPIHRLPVLYDDTIPTEAFTPNLINLQVINDRLLMSRPHGPRMRPADALNVLRPLVSSASRARLNEAFIRQRRLDRLSVWALHPIGPNVMVDDLSNFADVFRDGFPDRDQADIRARIRQANAERGHFRPNGDLRPGWRQVHVPEGTVDLFELYAEIEVAEFGLQLHWVDSWSYHVTKGEIHCGSYVLRRPRINPRNAWWRRVVQARTASTSERPPPELPST